MCKHVTRIEYRCIYTISKIKYEIFSFMIWFRWRESKQFFQKDEWIWVLLMIIIIIVAWLENSKRGRGKSKQHKRMREGESWDKMKMKFGKFFQIEWISERKDANFARKIIKHFLGFKTWTWKRTNPVTKSVTLFFFNSYLKSTKFHL